MYGKVLDRDLCNTAAYNGDLPVLKLARAEARARGDPWDERTCHWAAKAGHLEVLQWAKGQGCGWGAQTCYEAAWGGHLSVLIWARDEGCPWIKGDCERVAKRNANHQMLEWIRTSSSSS